ncbi:MAG: zinc-binding dehydrogenase [Verrucomicrobia bacterium]|nr:zinc-binding dehydrogenase [Verrucomicrobiota bacterium]
MKAVQLVAHGAPGHFEFADLPDPEAGPGEVVVRVRACGLNHLDLWLEKGDLPIPVRLPRTPGSEIAGEVVQTGANTEDWKSGERVAIQSNLFCGNCEYCRKGRESLCLRGELVGVDRNGGFAERVVVPAGALVRLPAEVSFETAAALTLAGSTAMHMLTNRVQIQRGDWVLVIGGAGGVGSAAIQIALGLGARVIATGSTAAKRSFALKLGAGHAVDSTIADWPEEIRRITGKRGVDVVVENVGGQVLERVFGCLARGGTIVTCGATAGRDLELKLWPFFVKEHRLVGSYGRTRHDLATTLDWAARGKLQPVVDRVFELAATPEAFRALRDRGVLGKLIVNP